jgi:molybdenum cofactor biosynthesis enzyme MoaA
MKNQRLFTVKAILKSIFYKKVPIYVHIQTTPFCNHACEFCGVIHSFDKQKALSIDDFVVMRDNLYQMGVGLVVLTGGEPMIRKDIFDIVRLFSEKGIEVRLQTNGSLLTRDVIERFNTAGLAGLTISLDSLHEHKMRKMTRADTFRQIIDGIVNSVKYGKFNIVAINAVINKTNLDEPEDIVRFVDFGWDMFDCVIPTREGRHGRLFLWKSQFKVQSSKLKVKEKSFYETININNKKYREIQLKSSGIIGKQKSEKSKRQRGFDCDYRRNCGDQRFGDHLAVFFPVANADSKESRDSNNFSKSRNAISDE